MADFLDGVGDIAKALIGFGAPTIGAAIGGPFGAIAGKILASAIGSVGGSPTDASPGALKLSLETLDPAARDKAVAQAEAEYSRTLAEEAKAAGIAVGEINQTIRTEIGSEDQYVRRGRPTIAYVFAYLAGLFGTVFAIVALIVVVRFDAPNIAIAFTALASLFFAVGGFLGVVMVPVTGWVNSRGREKEAQSTGQAAAPGIFGAIASAIGGRK